MKRMMMILMLLFTLCNVSFAAVYACICEGANGGSCQGKYCRTTSQGNCECQDVPFELTE